MTKEPISIFVAYNDGSDERYLLNDSCIEIAASLTNGVVPRRIEGLDENGNIISHFDFECVVILKEKERKYI